MADNTLIEWARHPVTGKGATWNIVTGCSVVSPGCTNCYAMKLAGTRLKHHESRKGLTVDTKAGPVWNGQTSFNEQWLTQPLQWQTPRGILVAAHGDLFAEGVTDAQLDRIFAVMALASQHVFFVLTKRPERMRDYLRAMPARASSVATAAAWFWGAKDPDAVYDWVAEKIQHALPNVWLGVSVEDQTRADERIPLLLDTPAAIRFISAEPLLGPVDLTKLPEAFFDATSNALTGYWSWHGGPSRQESAYLDWVIAGGESGPNARPMHPDWARALRDQCAEADVPFFFKQWGNWREAVSDWRDEDGNHVEIDPNSDEGEALFDKRYDKLMSIDGRLFTPRTLPDDTPARLIERIGKKAAGRELDGVTHDAMPEIRP